MVNRSIQSGRRYVLAFIIGTVLFFGGFLIVNSLSYLEYQRISNLQDQLAYKIFEDKLGYSLFGQEICSDDAYRKISEDLGFQGRIIDDLERKFGKEDARVLERKKFYSLILLEHFEFVNLINQECGKNIHTILFFYSNDLKYLTHSEDLGRMLGTVYGRNDNLVIYSFDVDLDSEVIKDLKDKYFIQEPLEILIDGDIKLRGVKSIDEIEQHL
ncbi:hypothetical protein COU53_02690 [Candidatus Pacearchaeota archaeon CG10_big_fil_rev_8_21_14_0_10_30_48]|nr:MAG: hypothetical protein COU53_02690 [Candidatus Pacearchaeota archaeon CG10_big_fil_rev_8_21_14_0_10_30_48]